MDFVEHRITVQDGLQIYCRDYGRAHVLPPGYGQAHLPVLLCLAGLTRNCLDFHTLASHLSPRLRVLAPDYRGRGQSDFDSDSSHYHPAIYQQDIGHLLTALNVHRVIVLGTSLGGLLGMGMAAVRPTALAGLILNDVGPEVAAEGIARILGYVGTVPNLPDQAAAITELQKHHRAAYPDFTEQDWTAMADRQFRRRDDGSYQLDYDPAIADALTNNNDAPTDFWPFYRAIRHLPVLAIRGALSDVLSPATFSRMAHEKSDLMSLTIANRGHVPTLSEPDAIAAIDTFLTQYFGV